MSARSSYVPFTISTCDLTGLYVSPSCRAMGQHSVRVTSFYLLRLITRLAASSRDHFVHIPAPL
jgi:hypothetical protein